MINMIITANRHHQKLGLNAKIATKTTADKYIDNGKERVFMVWTTKKKKGEKLVKKMKWGLKMATVYI